jgi:hypothetical protein
MLLACRAAKSGRPVALMAVHLQLFHDDIAVDDHGLIVQE